MTSCDNAVSFVTSTETSWTEAEVEEAAAATGSLIDSDMAAKGINQRERLAVESCGKVGSLV